MAPAIIPIINELKLASYKRNDLSKVWPILPRKIEWRVQFQGAARDFESISRLS